MKLKLVLILFAYKIALPFGLKAENCIQINQSNIGSINNIISKVANNGGGCVEIVSGDYYNVPAISLKSNVVLKINGNLYRDYGIISISNCENVKILGNDIGRLIYKSSEMNDTAKGIHIVNSRNIEINGLKIIDFRDKGVLIRGPNTKDIYIRRNFVKGAIGPTGVGIAVSDDKGDVTYSSIQFNEVENNRIGISVNKSKFIQIIGNNTYNNKLHGIGLDGIISLSGDGAQDCFVSNNLVYNNGGICESGKTKSGIYLGNGAKKNILSYNVIKNNKCNGVLYFEESDNQNKLSGNYFIGNQIIGNEKWGIRLKNSKRAIISNNLINFNKLGGVQLDASNSNVIYSNKIEQNGEIGVNFKRSKKNEIFEETNTIIGHNQKYKYE